MGKRENNNNNNCAYGEEGKLYYTYVYEREEREERGGGQVQKDVACRLNKVCYYKMGYAAQESWLWAGSTHLETVNLERGARD